MRYLSLVLTGTIVVGVGTAAAIEPMTLSVGDFRFEARAAGPETGELVLLLHGFPQTSLSYRHLLDALAAKGYHGVAPNQRGYSPGARPVDVDAYQMTHLVSDVVGMADALDRPAFHLVGHDWGAAVAWVTAARFPERVLSLTILSTPHPSAFGASLRDPDSEQSSRSAYMRDFAAPDAEERFLANGASFLRSLYGTAVPVDDVSTYVETFSAPGALTGGLNWYRASGLTRPPSPTAAPSTPPSLTVRVPTLYLFGLDDRAFSVEAAEASARFVEAPYRFEKLEGVGHWILEQAPERVARELEAHLSRARIESVLDQYDGLGFSGVALVARGDDVVSERAFGLAHVDEASPNTADTRFEVMSLSKLVTARAVTLLAADGRLELDAPLSDFWGDAVPADKRDIVVADLLRNTSGLLASGRDLDKADRASFVASILASPLEAPRGEVHYSSPGYALAAALVEEVTGRDFREIVRERIFGPAGMTQSGFTGEAEAETAAGYGGPLAEPEPVPAPVPGVGVVGATGVVGTARDFHRFVTRSVTTANVHPELLGFRVEERSGRRLLWKDGLWASFESRLVWYPEEQTVIVLLSNRNLRLTEAFGLALEDALFATVSAQASETPLHDVTTVSTSQPLRSLGRLGGLAVARDGELFVANFSASVWKVLPSGEAVRLLGSLRGSSGNTVDSQGRLLQASFLDGRIVRVTPDGQTVETIVDEGGGLEGPVGLVTDNEGNIYVCNCRGKSIARVDPKGSVSILARSDLFGCPNGITFGPGGELVVTNFEDGRVLKVSKDDGSVSLFQTLPEGQNAHIAFAGDAFYVTKVASNTVYRLELDGSFTRFAGSGERGLDDGPLMEASFATPNDIAPSSDGRFLYLNNLEGPWRGDVETSVVVRRIRLAR